MVVRFFVTLAFSLSSASCAAGHKDSNDINNDDDIDINNDNNNNDKDTYYDWEAWTPGDPVPFVV